MTRSAAAVAIQKNTRIKGVVGLVEEIRRRLDSGHYNFMTWNGRTILTAKLNEYESYARGPHGTSSQKERLRSMEAELHSLLDSTY